MRYIIVGAGVTGLSLAFYLGKIGHDVIIIEKEDDIGGSWNSTWVDGMYFSENSPKILVNGGQHVEFFKDIGVWSTRPVYKNQWGVVSFFLKHFEFFDYIIFLTKTTKDETVREWMDSSDLSQGARDAIRVFCILINDTPEKTHVKDFFGFLRNFHAWKNPVQFRDPNEWHQRILEKFREMGNVRVVTGCACEEMIHDGRKAVSVKCDGGVVEGDRFVLCTQSTGLFGDNWGDIESWKKETHYDSFGFQIHFDRDVEFPSEWCWACLGDWTVIILPVSEYLDEFRRDSRVKTVWSCCVTDLNSKSSFIGKSANECEDTMEVVEEALRQINCVNPYRITLSPGLLHDGEGWVSRNTGFTRGRQTNLPMKGKLDNVFALGCFTIPGEVAHCGTAVGAVKLFLSKYESRRSCCLTLWWIVLLVLVMLANRI